MHLLEKGIKWVQRRGLEEQEPFAPPNEPDSQDIKQAFLKIKREGSETIVLGNYVFNQEIARCAFRHMIVLHEYPLSIVDHVGFKEFCATLQPLFKGICQNTLKSDIMKDYHEMKQITMKLFAKIQNWVAITSDM